ncbi:SusE domain-containing protein [Limibacter armeniacum]|uniref:SusE domain-containing protein n=1 Tax=Limibacter armeniacum TaxID=466084 RepID=UPI002FE6ACF3
MKKITTFLAYAALLILGFSCQDNDTMDPIGGWTLSAPTLDATLAGSTITLSEEALDPITVKWNAAQSTAGYLVTYKVLVSPENDTETIWFEKASDNAGKGTSISISHAELDDALSTAGLEVGTTTKVALTVVANSMETLTTDSQAFSVTRFETEAMPSSLYLFEDGEMVKALTKDGRSFISEGYLSLSAGKSYTLNTAEDQSGKNYSLSEAIGTTASPDGDKVEGSISFEEGGTDAFTVAKDQLYQISLDFDNTIVSWKYYNIKLFHWENWDGRDELLMTYETPNTFTLTATLKAGYEMKFNSPWDIQLGTETPDALSGNLINGGGENFTCITEDGEYTVTITVSEDYSVGTYQFVKN